MRNFLIIHTQSSSIQSNYEVDPKNFDQWTRLVSFSWLSDYNSVFNIIRPIGFHIDPKTSQFIEITNEYAILNGKEIVVILKEFLKVLKNVDYIVGHNIDYHLNLIKSELYRFNLINEFPNIPTICTMVYGKKLFDKTSKFPNLNELYNLIYKKDIKKEINENNPKNKIINIIYAIKYCFNHMLEKNIFIDLNIISLPNFFIIPHNNDNFFDFKIKFENNNLYYENSIIFKNVINYKEFKGLGLSLVELINYEKTEFVLIDYRGVLILKDSKEIDIVFDWHEESNIIKINNSHAYYLTNQENFILLHRFEDFKKIYNNIIINNFFNENTLIKPNGEVPFINKKIIYNENSEYFIVIDHNTAKILNLEFKNIITLNKIDYEFVEINNNIVKYLDNNKLMGIIDLNKEFKFNNFTNTIIFLPKFKYVDNLTSDILIYSNDFDQSEYGVSKIGKMGICDINGNVIARDLYYDIEIEDNKIIGYRDGISEVIKTN